MVDLPDSYTRLSWGERGRICELLTQQVHPRRSDTALAERLVEEIRGMASGGKPRWLAAPEHRAALVAWLIEAGVLEQADVWERPDVDLDALEKAKTRYYEGNDERLAAEAAGTPWSTEQVATWDAETRPFFDGRRVQYGPRFYTKDQEPPEGAVLSTGSPTPGRWTVADDDLDLTPEEMTRSWRQSCMEYELAWLGRTGGCPSTRTEANNE